MAKITAMIRNGVTQAHSTSVNFVAKLPAFDAALVAAVIGGVVALVSETWP